MGFSLRRSFKIAPGVRFNISSKGLGVSVGVKGARVSAGPRGVQFRGGIGPLRYQQTLSGRDRKRKAIAAPASRSEAVQLKRPRNWHAWLAFFCMGMPNAAVSSLKIELISTLAIYVGLGFWIYTLFTGPRSLKAFRRYEKKKFKELPAAEKVAFLEEIYSSYPALPVRADLAQALCDMDRHGDALPHLQALVEEVPTPMMFAALGQCLFNLGRFDEALPYFESCDEEEEFDGFLIVIKLKAKCLIGKREFDGALECIDRGLRRRGEEHVEGKRALRVLKAEVYLATNEPMKARKELERLVAEVPGYQEALALLARIKAAA